MGTKERERRVEVFFYGLFMDEELLRGKGLEPESGEIAAIDGFALRISQRAALVPTPGAKVYPLFLSFSSFWHRDDGAIADGYTDTVGRLLANDWQDFHGLALFVTEHMNFESFVLRHIDDTLPIVELKTIERNAKQSCPTDQSVLCGKILNKARSAMANNTLPSPRTT